jgi:thiosulfate/3-mercaptopyruvate sulfurtransferase
MEFASPLSRPLCASIAAPAQPARAGAVPPGFRADLPRWRQLVSVDWLSAWLAGAPVPAAPASDCHLFDVACDAQAAFLAGHIPGARYLDTRQFEQLPFWNQRPDADVLRVLQGLGIGPLSTVILCAHNMLAAARVAHLMLVAGVQDVRLLDGGLTAWCAASQRLQQGVTPQCMLSSAMAGVAGGAAFAPGAAPPPRFAARPDYLIHTAQARALRVTEGSALVSIRTRSEYLGETSGYSYIPARGEIAGALWGHAGVDGDVNSMRNFQDALGRMKPASEIAALWDASGVRADMRVAFYCGTGWRASMAFFYAWLMGWERISVYDGGWFEWSSDPSNPTICRTAALR